MSNRLSRPFQHITQSRPKLSDDLLYCAGEKPGDTTDWVLIYIHTLFIIFTPVDTRAYIQLLCPSVYIHTMRDMLAGWGPVASSGEVLG